MTQTDEEKTAGTKRQTSLLTKRQQRHIVKEIVKENDDVYPTNSKFWTEFFKRAGLDIFSK